MIKSPDASRVLYGNLLPAPGEYGVDPVHSFVEFSVQHAVVGQVRGRFDSISGMVRVADDPLLSSIEVHVDTASLSTHHKGRDEDLRSQRFFDVEKFPKMSYLSTGIRSEPGGRFTVDGNLTLRGTTRPLSLAADFTGIIEDQWGNIRAGFQATASLNRKDFGLTAELDRETGGLLVGKDVHIRIAAEVLLKSKVSP